MPTRGREFAADRRWDILLLIGAFFVITGAVHLTMMLFVGDWDIVRVTTTGLQPERAEGCRSAQSCDRLHR